MPDWTPGLHPRGPLGRFIDAPPRAAFAPSPRVSSAQRQMFETGIGGDGMDSVSNAYRRGTFSGPPMNRLPHEQKTQVESYIWDTRVNNDLRNGTVDRFQQEQVDRLDEVIELNRVTRDTLVYRGVTAGTLDGAQPGDQIIDQGFMSTSMNPSVSEDYGGDLIEIELPKGTHAAPISKVDSYQFSPIEEVLVGRGAVLEIDSIENTNRVAALDEPVRIFRARLVGYSDGTPFGTKERKTYGSTSIEQRVRPDGAAEITDVQTHSGSRGQGSGRAAMQRQLAQNDAAGRTTILVPEPQDGQTNKRQLQEFYRSLGFVPNTGPSRNRAYGTHFWIRPPRSG